MARDKMGAFQIAKASTAGTAAAQAFTFTFSSDCGNVSAIEIRSIHFGVRDVPANGTTPLAHVTWAITQGSLTFSFATHLAGGGHVLYFPDGFSLKASDGDTVTLTLTMAGTSNSVVRDLLIRAMV